MAETRSIGLKHIKIGAIAGDGGMGTSLAILGVTYRDTAELTQDDNDITDIFSEENDDPEESIATPGVKRLKWSIFNFDPDVLVQIFGGEATGTAPNKIWSAPEKSDFVEKSIEILTEYDLEIKIPRAKLFAKLNMPFRKKGVALVDIEARILMPTKANTAQLTIQKKAS